MANYVPDLNNQIPLVLLVPTIITKNGVPTKTFPKLSDVLFEDSPFIFYGSFKTYGGTERVVNDVYSIEDTAIIETWFRPDITSACKIALANSGAMYDIIGEPEDINQRHQFLKFKVRRIKGGA